MAEIRRLEVKNINIISVFKYCGGFSFIISLVLGFFGDIISVSVQAPECVKTLPFIANIGTGAVAAAIFAVIYGLIVGMISSVSALLYNIFAGILGGIVLSVEQEIV